jgi:hypothetical protein
MAATEPMTFRSRTAVIVWVIWLLFAVGNWADLAVQGRDHGTVVAAAGLLLATGIVYVAALRPVVIADDAGITVRNPLRDHRIGWPAVAKVDLADLLRVHCDWGAGEGRRKVISAWAVHHSRRREFTAEARERRAALRRTGYRTSPFDAPATGPRRGRATTYSARATSYGTPAPARSSEAQRAASLLAERVPTEQQRAEPPRSTWSWPAIAAIAVPALILLVVCLV